MPNGDGNDNGIKKKKIGLISKKNTLDVQHTFLYISLPFFFHDYNAKLSSYMLYGGN